MKIVFDPIKSKKNEMERGLPFSLAHEFDWQSAVYREDIRFDYPERRFVAVSNLGGRLHFICFSRIEDGVRIISFRKASKNEVKEYEQETADR